MRPALALVLLAIAAPLWAQLPADGQTSYSRDDRIRIPFELRNGGRATKVALYFSFDGGPWQEYESARQGQRKEFIFRADRDGPYSFATMTYFSDGTTDPRSKADLTEQRRVIIDKTPPRVNSVRPIPSADGAPGIEWDVTDEFPDPRGVKLEFRWDGMGRFEPIDRNVPFNLRDSRHWQLKSTDRMQVRVVAIDRAGNRAESDPVWVAGRDADRGGPVDNPRSPVTGTSSGSVRDSEVSPAAGRRLSQAALHYVNEKAVKLNINATAGPSGLTKASLWWADEKFDWQQWKEQHGPKPAPPVTDPDKPRLIPVEFTFAAPKDGTYSFVIVLENHRGQNRPEPKKGDAGDVQVVVDTTKPVVELISTRVAPHGDRGAIVDIRWKATDANIAPVPVKLEYQAVSGQGGGWKQITPDWVDNTGQHTWTAPTGEGYLFDIRVVCKDRAGNETTVGTSKPVNVDLARPGVSGVDVVPGRGGALGPNPGNGGSGGAGGFPDVPMINVGGSSKRPDS